MTVALPDEIHERNIRDRERYADRFIDMIGMVQTEDGRMPCFTDDKRFFTIDYGHLSRPGAQCYARKLENGGLLQKVMK